MTTKTESADLSALRINREDGSGAPGNRWRRKYAVVIIALLALLVGAFLLWLPASHETEVETATVSLSYPSEQNAVLAASGYVVAQQKASVASKGTGRLEYLGVEEGDRVRKGQVIARLESSDVEAQLAKARADLEVTKADSEDAKLSLDRQQTLLASNLTSRAEVDAAKARFNRVVAAIKSAEAAVVAAEVTLENTRIRAPFDGTVLTKNANVGEVVAPFGAAANARGAVVTMADMTSLDVEADVSESNITRVKPGQPCEIILDAYPDVRYQGYVHKIVPTADRSKATVLTKVKFRNRDERVLPEMSAKITFLSEALSATAAAPPELTVPASTLVRRGTQSIVFRVADGKAIETAVTVGPQRGTRVVIGSGLTAGDQVVLRPDGIVRDGTRIRPRLSQPGNK